MTVNYVYLGYGTTDENGECKLDHDANGDPISHSYTGTGAGKIDVVASLDSPSSISDSSLVSETFELWDYICYDKGTQSNHNDIWDTSSAYSILRESEYTQIIESDATNWSGIWLNYLLNPNIRIEFDINQKDGLVTSFFWEISKTKSSGYINGGGLNNVSASLNTWYHCVIDIGETSTTMTMNNNTRTFTYDALSSFYFGFWLSREISEINFKNFKIYSI